MYRADGGGRASSSPHQTPLVAILEPSAPSCRLRLAARGRSRQERFCSVESLWRDGVISRVRDALGAGCLGASFLLRHSKARLGEALFAQAVTLTLVSLWCKVVQGLAPIWWRVSVRGLVERSV